MKRALRVLAALLAALGLLLATGCGSAVSNETNFQGKWGIVSFEKDGTTYSKAELDQMQSSGLDLYIELNEGGKAKVSLLKESKEGTWKATDASTVEITIDGDTITGKLADDQLTLEQSGQKLVFAKQ